MHEKAVHPAKLLTGKAIACLLLSWAFFCMPGSAFAVLVHVDAISSKNGTVLAFPDVAKTPAPPAGPVPIPYPLVANSEKDATTGKTKVTTELVIRSEKIPSTTGDEGGLSKGLISNSHLGIKGKSIQFFWDTNVEPGETAVLSILLADPTTGRAIGPNYKVDVTDTQTGSVSFDISNLPTVEFEIILLAIQTSSRDLPTSRLLLTDFAVDGVSVVDQFGVSQVPLPPALLLFASGMLGLALIRRRRTR